MFPFRRHQPSASSNSNIINTEAFYAQYHGHPASLLKALVENAPTPRIWLAGDSTLDNKYWIPKYNNPHSNPHHASLLRPPFCKRDLSYWLNTELPQYITINCAVEATTLSQRSSRLLRQDEIIRDEIASEDILIVCIGGNDIALCPSLKTIFSVFCNVYFGGDRGVAHLRTIFRDQMQDYISRLVSKQKPRLVAVCLLYFPDEAYVASWANWVLCALRYQANPERLQNAIKRLFDQAVAEVHLEDTCVVHVPFFEALDGKRSELYVERVEPSEEGGQAMAQLLKEKIYGAIGGVTKVEESTPPPDD